MEHPLSSQQQSISQTPLKSQTSSSKETETFLSDSHKRINSHIETIMMRLITARQEVVACEELLSRFNLEPPVGIPANPQGKEK